MNDLKCSNVSNERFQDCRKRAWGIVDSSNYWGNTVGPINPDPNYYYPIPNQPTEANARDALTPDVSG